MFDLIKIVAILFVVLGLGIAVIRATPEDGAGGASFTLFDIPAKQASKPPERDLGPAGIVIEHRDGALLVMPWEAGGAVEVVATEVEREGCPVGARVPDCLR